MEVQICISNNQFPPNGNNDSRTVVNILKDVPFLKQASAVSMMGKISTDINDSYCLTHHVCIKDGRSTDTDSEETKIQALATIPSALVILQQSFKSESTSPIITLQPVQVGCCYWDFVLSALSFGVTLVFYDKKHRKFDGHNLWRHIARSKVRHALILETHIDFLRKAKIQPNPKLSFQFLRRISLQNNSLPKLHEEYLMKYLKNGAVSQDSHAMKFCYTNSSSVHEKHLRSRKNVERIVKNGYHLISEADTVRRLQTPPWQSPTYAPPCFCAMFIYIFIVWMLGMLSE